MSACPSCGSADVIGFTLAPAGDPVAFRNCRSCEHRWWQKQDSGDVMVLREVLDRIAAA